LAILPTISPFGIDGNYKNFSPFDIKGKETTLALLNTIFLPRIKIAPPDYELLHG